MVPDSELRGWITLKSAIPTGCAICALILFPFKSVIKVLLIEEELGPSEGELYVWLTACRKWKCVEAKCGASRHQTAACVAGGGFDH